MSTGTNALHLLSTSMATIAIMLLVMLMQTSPSLSFATTTICKTASNRPACLKLPLLATYHHHIHRQHHCLHELKHSRNSHIAASSSSSSSSSSPYLSRIQKVANLREMLRSSQNGSRGLIVMPCCYDGLTARLVEDAGFELTFMTGFGVR